jgi:hypothetical protein
VDAATGAADPHWNPMDTNYCHHDETFVAAGGKHVYMGGLYDHYWAPTKRCNARLDQDTSVTDPGWNPNFGCNISVIAVDGTNIYTAGIYTNINGYWWSRFARLDSITGVVDTNLDQLTDDEVFTIAACGTNIYIGGKFTAIGSQPALGLAKLDPVTGRKCAAWQVNVERLGTVEALARQNDGKIIVVGIFVSVNGIKRDNMFRLNPDGSLDAEWNPHASNTIERLTVSGTNMFAGGLSYSNNAPSRSSIVRLSNPAGAADTNWNLEVAGYVMALAANSNSIYVGGIFSAINGNTCENIARLDKTTGIIDTRWNHRADGSVDVLLMDGTNLYLGGSFSSVDGESRLGFAVLGIGQ